MAQPKDDLVDLRGLTLIHKDTSNRTLDGDRHAVPGDYVQPALRRNYMRPSQPTGQPCTCAVPTISRDPRDRQDICRVCMGWADRRFHTPMDELRAGDPQEYRRQLLAMGIPAATIDRALAQDEAERNK